MGLAPLSLLLSSRANNQQNKGFQICYQSPLPALTARLEGKSESRPHEARTAMTLSRSRFPIDTIGQLRKQIVGSLLFCERGVEKRYNLG